jgi:hypothetical protein
MTTTATTASLALAKVLDVGVASVSVELGFVIAPVSMDSNLSGVPAKKRDYVGT